MTYFFVSRLYILLFVAHCTSTAHPYCITQDHRKNNDLTTTIIGTTNPVNPDCSCSCTERRFGGNDVCVTCNHRHIADTSQLKKITIAPGLVEINAYIAQCKTAKQVKCDYSNEETE